ncbi:hypothetical protein [Haladaptatus sp. NG-WS-4]
MTPKRVSNSKKIHLMGRRRFMQTLVGLGVSSAALPHLSQEVIAEMHDPKSVIRVDGLVNTEDLPVQVSHLGSSMDLSTSTPDPTSDYLQKSNNMGRRVPILTTTPYPKWKEVEAARDARRRLAAQIPTAWTSHSDYLTIRVAVEVDSVVKNRHDPVSRYLVPIYPIIVRPDGEVLKPSISFDEFSQYFPPSIRGVAGRGTYLESSGSEIPIRPERREEELHAYYDYSYRPVPAGCIFGTGADNSATLGMPAKNQGNNASVFLTAAHIFKTWPFGWSKEVHQPVWIQNNDEFKIGVTDPNRRVNKNNFDAVVVRNLSANTTRDYAANDGPNTYLDGYPIRGILTNSDLYDRAGDQSFELTKQGVATGRRSGFISSFDGSIVGVRAYSNPGDSGGPYFHEYYEPQFQYGYSLAAGIHKGKSGSTANATAIEKIENRFNVIVGT